MGTVYIRPSSCSEDAKITLDNTLMVATKTLKDVLSIPRFDMGVAADDNYISFTCGINESGRAVSNIDFLDRWGQHYTANWPDELTDVAAIMTNNRLIVAGGRYSDGQCSSMVKRWLLCNALFNNGVPTSMKDLPSGRYGASIIKLGNDILVVGGILANGVACDGVFSYSTLNTKGTNQDNGYKYLFALNIPRGFLGVGRVTDGGILLSGGKDVANNTVTGEVNVIGENVSGVRNLGARNSLEVAQEQPISVEIYLNGFRYLLVGLGLTLPTSQGNLVSPARVVPNIDIYASNYNDDAQIQGGKYGTATLDFEGVPTSAVGFSFGDCALFVVGYNDGVTKNKGYLVRVNPWRVTPIEFNFSRSYMQGGVIGKDTAYIGGGLKDGYPTKDIEMIKLIRNAPIYPGMKYKLGDMTSEETASSLTLHPLNGGFKLSGYMKL